MSTSAQARSTSAPPAMAPLGPIASARGPKVIAESGIRPRKDMMKRDMTRPRRWFGTLDWTDVFAREFVVSTDAPARADKVRDSHNQGVKAKASRNSAVARIDQRISRSRRIERGRLATMSAPTNAPRPLAAIRYVLSLIHI